MLIRLPILATALAAAAAFAQSATTPLDRRITQPVAEVALHPQREAPAQSVSLNESRIAAEINGRILELPVQAGQIIAAGAVVARLECRDHELALERARAANGAARARLDLAEQQLRRARGLAEKGFISGEALDTRASELEVMRADAAQAQAQLGTAERTVEKCVVHAPFRAIVRQRLGQLGELAMPGTALAALADAGRIEVVAQVPFEDAVLLARAGEIRFVGDAGTRRLKLLRVSPAIDPQARTTEVRLAFSGEAAPPGASGRIAWLDPRPHLPAELLVRRDRRLGVFVEDSGVARFHALPLAQEGRPAVAELPPATRIVVGNPQSLKDGQRLGVHAAP